MFKRMILLFLCLFTVFPARAENATPLTYALPSAYVRYQRQTETWFLDCAVSRKCVVNFEVYADEAEDRLAASVRKRIDNSGIFRIAWNGRNGDRRVEPGRYHCRVYASDHLDQAVRFTLEIIEGKPEEIALAPNGPLLPASMDDETVWKSMMQPLVVVDIDAESHQKIYAEPDPKSEVLGHVHGQSQGLEVVETGAHYTRVRAWRHEDDLLVEGYVPTKKLKIVRPNTHYGLLVDKTAQVMTVYEHGKPIGKARISTGLPTQEKKNRETRTGAFMTTDRLIAFESNGFWCEYPIRFDGGNLLHQVGCLRTDDGKDFSVQQALLGQKASEGCVRVSAASEDGYEVDAYWLWTHVEYGTKVIVVDNCGGHLVSPAGAAFSNAQPFPSRKRAGGNIQILRCRPAISAAGSVPQGMFWPPTSIIAGAAISRPCGGKTPL